METHRNWLPWGGIIPWLLFGLSLVIRFYFISAFQFDGLYGQDAFAYFNQAVAIAYNLPHGQLPPLNFFWPNGYPLLTALFMGILGKTEWAALLPVLLTGSAIAPLAYLLCREFEGGSGTQANADERPTIGNGEQAGLLAGLIIAVAGQPILSSVTSMADMPALFWAMLGTWCLVRAREFPQAIAVPTSSPENQELVGTHRNWWELWLTLAGLFLGFATITRWLYAALALPFAGYALYQTRKFRAPIWPLLLPALAGLFVILPQVWLSTHRPEGLLHAWLLGWRPANFFANTFQTPDGLQKFERLVAIFNVLPAIHPAYLFPLLGMGIPFGFWALWRDKAWDALILLAGWAGLMYLFLAGIPYENFRFGLSLYPPLVILSAIGFSRIMFYVSRFTRPRILEVGYWIIVGSSLIFMLGWAYRMVGTFLETQNASKTQVLEIAAQLHPGATVITLGPTLIFDHYTTLKTVEFYFANEESLNALMIETPSLFLLLDVPDTEGRWKGMGPQILYAWLKTHTSLVPRGEFPPYTLFEIQTSLPSLK